MRIEQHDRADRADRRADPEAAVDDEIGPSAIARRHQFLDRRIDRGVFAADAGAGEKSKQRVARDAPGQRGRRGRGEIERQRDEEQFLAPDPVGQPAEAERAEHGAGKIGAVGKSDIEIGEMQRRTFLQRPGQRAGQRDLQPIQNPGDAERQHDAGVKAAPAQAIETRGNVGFDDAIIVLPDASAETRHVVRTALQCAAHPSIQPVRNAPGNAGTPRLSSVRRQPSGPPRRVNAFGRCEFPHCGTEPHAILAKAGSAIAGRVSPTHDDTPLIVSAALATVADDERCIYAARIFAMKRSSSSRNRVLSVERVRAEFNTSAEADPVSVAPRLTCMMLAAASWVPWATV